MANRRVLLAEVTPRIPQAWVYATWNPSDKASAITLSGGNLIATKSTTNASAWACVRGTVPMQAGQWYWETTYNFTGTADVACGISTLNPSLIEEPGIQSGTDEIMAGPNRLGQCLFEGGPVATTGAVSTGDVIRHWLDTDAGIYRVAVNGGAWVEVFDGAPLRDYTWYPIAGIMRPVGSTGSVTANFGGSPFAYPIPDGVNAGIYSIPASIEHPLYLSSDEMITGPGDTPADTTYDARIAGDQDVEVEREVGCWVWGDQTRSQRGKVVCVNADGALDGWRDYDWRDAPITLYVGDAGGVRSKYDVWMTAVVDTIDFTDGGRVELNLLDPLALLDRAVQTALYPDDQANAQAAGKPLPIVVGRPLYCEGVLLDTAPAARNYQLHDASTAATGYSAGITSIDAIYDRGDLFAGPDDPYTAHNPITLANGGQFSSWATDAGGFSMPSNWGRVTTFGASNDRFQQGVSAGTLRMLSSGQLETAIYHSASTLQAGRRYTIAFTVTALTTAGQITFRCDGPTPNLPFDDVVVSIAATGAVSVTLDVTETAQLQIVLGRTQLDATIDNLTVSSTQIIDWTYWLSGSDRAGFHLANTAVGKVVANPVGPTAPKGGGVAEYLPEVLEYLLARTWSAYGIAGTPPDVSASAAALHALAPYRVAMYFRDAVTQLQLLRNLMDSWCGWIVPTLSGDLTVGRVAAPSQTAVLTLDETNIKGDVTVTDDVAKSLTLRLGGRRNNAPHGTGDFATSVSAAMRAELSAELTCIRTGAPALTTGAVSPAYAQAITAPVQATMLQEPADIQAEANRVATLFRPKRAFYSLTAIIGASAADTLEPGQTVRLVWPRYGLSGGKNLLVKRVRSRLFSRATDLTLWG